MTSLTEDIIDSKRTSTAIHQN